MKTYDIARDARESAEGEAIVGFQRTGSHACYLLYGVLKPGERGRVVKPGRGHEEILLAIKGDLVVTGFFAGTLTEGSAIHLSGEQECLLENTGDSEALYVIAGGHSEGGHH
ncbi:MAG: hypothetical protein ACM3ON_08285 [Chloroflexota bacterium]